MEKVQKEGSYLFEMIKALIISLIISLLLVLAEAFAIMLFNLDEGLINIINQVIKGLTILTVTLIVFKLPKNGWLRGLIFGILYALITYAVFSLLDGSFSFSLNILNDVAFLAAGGFISGILVSVIRK